MKPLKKALTKSQGGGCWSPAISLLMPAWVSPLARRKIPLRTASRRCRESYRTWSLKVGQAVRDITDCMPHCSQHAFSCVGYTVSAISIDTIADASGDREGPSSPPAPPMPPPNSPPPPPPPPPAFMPESIPGTVATPSEIKIADIPKGKGGQALSGMSMSVRVSPHTMLRLLMQRSVTERPRVASSKTAAERQRLHSSCSLRW